LNDPIHLPAIELTPGESADANGRSPGTRRMAFGWANVARLPAQGLLALIRLYQLTLSPMLPVVLGSNCGCRYSPSCSRYAAGAVRTHGALAGTWLAARRLLRCTPFHPGGYDPVPPAARSRPVCQSAIPLISWTKRT
jgi:hypothetical protein